MHLQTFLIQYDQGIGHLLSFLGSSYEHMGKFETSLTYYMKLLKRDEQFKDSVAMKLDLESISKIYKKLNRPKIAEEWANRAKKM